MGIDPGKTGAIVIINELSVKTYGMPLISKEYDMQKFKILFQNFSSLDCHIVIEDVKALQGKFKSGNWALSRGKTILEVYCHALNIPHTLVHSKTWQREMWQGVPKQYTGALTEAGNRKIDTKAMSLIAANRLFPTIDKRDPNRKTERAQSIHDGVVDALLMAEYGRRRNL